MAIKKHDFVEIEYTGKLKDGLVFDTTDEKVARDNNIHNPNMSYGPATICIGEHQIIRGLDDNLVGKNIGKSYTVELKPEEGFGKKSTKLIQLIPTSRFKQENINPVPGLQINIDGIIGIVKTVTGGRTIVDFNHPLSGKDIVYDVKLNKLVTDKKEKIKAFVKISLNQDIEVKKEKDSFNIELKQDISKEIKKKVKEKLKEIIKVKKVIFTLKKWEILYISKILN